MCFEQFRFKCTENVLPNLHFINSHYSCSRDRNFSLLCNMALNVSVLLGHSPVLNPSSGASCSKVKTSKEMSVGEKENVAFSGSQQPRKIVN